MDRRRAPEELRTARLVLRQWRSGDRAALARINADARVMRHVAGGPLSRAASDDLQRRMVEEWRMVGHGLWAVERRDDGELLGLCGLAVPSFVSRVLPAAEIGWRLRPDAWGHGYATEAARAALAVAWRALELRQVIAVVDPGNDRSLAVGERLGMRVTNRMRHAGSGQDVLVLRADRPDDELAGARQTRHDARA